MKNRLKGKDGFTLAELILILVLLGVVLAAALSFFLYGNITYVKDDKQYDLQKNARIDMDSIISKTTYSTEFYLLDAVPTTSEKESSTYNYIYLSNGLLYFSDYNSSTGNRTETVGKGTYLMASSIFLKDTSTNDNFTVELSCQQNTQTYSIDATVKLVNLKLVASYVQGSDNSQVIKYNALTGN